MSKMFSSQMLADGSFRMSVTRVHIQIEAASIKDPPLTFPCSSRYLNEQMKRAWG